MAGYSAAGGAGRQTCPRDAMDAASNGIGNTCFGWMAIAGARPGNLLFAYVLH